MIDLVLSKIKIAYVVVLTVGLFGGYLGKTFTKGVETGSMTARLQAVEDHACSTEIHESHIAKIKLINSVIQPHLASIQEQLAIIRADVREIRHAVQDK